MVSSDSGKGVDEGTEDPVASFLEGLDGVGGASDPGTTPPDWPEEDALPTITGDSGDGDPVRAFLEGLESSDEEYVVAQYLQD